MMTALQEYINELKEYKKTTFVDKLVITFWIVKAEKLLQKEKEQIQDAYAQGYSDGVQEPNPNDDYYNETYKL